MGARSVGAVRFAGWLKRHAAASSMALGFACANTTVLEADPSYDAEETLAGGAATSFDTSRQAFGQLVPGVGGEREDEFFVGNAIFNRAWVSAPASVTAFDGLGPIFNASNCAACHMRDGRGTTPDSDEAFLGLLLRLSVPGTDTHGAPKPEPTYGGQVQGRAVLNVPAEARERVTYTSIRGTYADGETFELRAPTYAVTELAHGPMRRDVMMSPRIAPGVYGSGLIEAIADETILQGADPEDRDGDGISGRPNWVHSARYDKVMLGRFGWKAGQPTVLDQSAAAFNGDLGVTSRWFPQDDCTAPQDVCRSRMSGTATGKSPFELDDALLASVVHYQRLLAVPARRQVRAPEVLRGRRVFFALGCASCHTPKLETGFVADAPELSHQTIRPYTDLLLHDMGDALADGRPEFVADGREWKTPPLWGLGLTPVVNRHLFLMHDGRARGFAEAVLWHGGEAERVKDGFLRASRSERAALVAFLESM